MKEIGWTQFHEKLKHYCDATPCPYRKAIAAQITLLGKKSGSFSDYVLAARDNAPVAWSGDADNLIENFRHGRGHQKMAVAIHFWFHTVAELKSYAHAVDTILFGHTFEEEYDDLVIPVRTTLKGVEEPDDHLIFESRPNAAFVDVEALQRLLDSVDLTKQKYPALIQLMIEIEHVMGMECVRSEGSDELFVLRNSLNQKNWLTATQIQQIRMNSFEWKTKIGDFSLREQGVNLVVVREDGMRISSCALHRINSWLKAIWKLHKDEMIALDDIDVFIRYILVFVQANRSQYMKMYFPEDAGIMDVVFRLALRRAKRLELDMRDYSPIDEEYKQFYHAI